MRQDSAPSTKPARNVRIELPALPYPIDALEPVISRRTLEFHHGQHHQAYVDGVNELVRGSEFAGRSLEDIVRASSGAAKTARSADAKLFNHAAQAWNHAFYWNSLQPNGGGGPRAALLRRIEHAFRSYAEFKSQLVEAAVAQFGSGWAWLVEEEGALKIVTTANADLPLLHGQRALLTIDVWEHAYYLDHQNLRKRYVQQVVDKLLNWEWAEKQLG